MQPSNQTTQDVAVGGLIAGLVILSAFPATSKFAIYLGLFLLFLVWFSAWRGGTLQSFVTALQNFIHG